MDRHGCSRPCKAPPFSEVSACPCTMSCVSFALCVSVCVLTNVHACLAVCICIYTPIPCRPCQKPPYSSAAEAPERSLHFETPSPAYLHWQKMKAAAQTVGLSGFGLAKTFHFSETQKAPNPSLMQCHLTCKAHPASNKGFVQSADPTCIVRIILRTAGRAPSVSTPFGGSRFGGSSPGFGLARKYDAQA